MTIVRRRDPVRVSGRLVPLFRAVLFPKDVDLESGAIRILNGKGGRARTVGIDPAAGDVVACWLAIRAQLGLGGRHPLSCTLAGVRR